MTNPATTPTPAPEQIVRASDGVFTAEYRINAAGVTEMRSAMTGEAFEDDWAPAPEFQARDTLAGRFFAAVSAEDIANRLSRNIGKPGNWTTVEIANA
jgi:hypothetical protein